MSTFLNFIINTVNVSLMIYTLYLFFDHFSNGRISRLGQALIIMATGIVSVLILTFTYVGIIRTVCFIAIPIFLSFIVIEKIFQPVKFIIIFCVRYFCLFLANHH